MDTASPSPAAPSPQGKSDFWVFWIAQTISNVGNSITQFAIPLLVFELTRSPLNLAAVTAIQYLPYLLFGLIIGAWVDRVDRKRLMIVADVIRSLVISSIPILAFFGELPIWWIYIASFINATVSIGSNTAATTAVASLVSKDSLVKANGRLQASHSAGFIIGPTIAALLITVIPITTLILIDGISFFVSAGLLCIIKRSFNTAEDKKREYGTISQDIVEGLRYVLGHPLLRSIAFMIAFVNLFVITTRSQLVLFAEVQLNATESQISLLYSMGAAGVVLLSLLANFLSQRFSFAFLTLGPIILQGILLIIIATTNFYWLTAITWGICLGLTHLFSINTRSIRQMIVPNHMLGRVISIGNVLAWVFIPIGSFLGGWAVDVTGDVALIYAGIGVAVLAIPILFSFSALGRADSFIQAEQASTDAEKAPASP